MAAFLKLKPSFHKLRPLLLHQRFCQTTVFEGCAEADSFAELGPVIMGSSGDAGTSKWKKLDARSLGIKLSMIPSASKTVIKILQSEGYDAFLVGGCVRDLLLNRTPKDFDVITTANLKEVKNIFYRCLIVGRRFPICLVKVQGFEIEVSSFDTVATHGKEKEVHLSTMPKGCDEKDFMRWRNSLHRDFTVNSLFYDPFAHKIYDYSNAMRDLRAKKIRTVVPAHSSFQVDCARILRGLRIAARLGFSFAKDTEKAVHDLHASVTTLDKARLMMEINYMLSYGAAQSSLLLLTKFNLLKILLPFHAAYLVDNAIGESPSMLMELFSKLDGMVSCDQPCHASLWVSLLAFHLALANSPQDALVVRTLASLLYHGTWEEGVKASRKLSEEQVNFAGEIRNTAEDVADDELAQRVSNFASIVLDSIRALTDSHCLRKIMDHHPSYPCSDGVFVSYNAGRAVADIFHVLVNDIKSLNEKRQNYMIDYELLGKGDILETRYVLGKVIMDTMRVDIKPNRPKLLSEHFHASKLKSEQVELSKKPNAKVVKHETDNHEGGRKHRLEGPKDQLNQQKTKKRKLVKEKSGKILDIADGKEQVELSKKTNAKAVKYETHDHKGGEEHILDGPNEQLNRQTTKKKKLVEEKLGEIQGTADTKKQVDLSKKKPKVKAVEQKTTNHKGGEEHRSILEGPNNQLNIQKTKKKKPVKEKLAEIQGIADGKEQVELSKKPKEKAFKETHNERGGGKHELEGPNDQLNLQTTKKTKLTKEKLGGFQGIANIKEQLTKKVVKEVQRLFSMYQEIGQPDAKPEICQQSEVQPPKYIPTMLKKVPSTKQLPTMGENHYSEPLEEGSSVLENTSEVLKPHKAEAPIEMLNVLKVSDSSKVDDEDHSNNYSKQEKQPTVGAQGQDKSKTIKKSGILSRLF